MIFIGVEIITTDRLIPDKKHKKIKILSKGLDFFLNMVYNR